jgi:uncharacterized membrane protein YedE/YeeE
MSRHIVALLTGIIFGLGLAVSGMINPEKVLGFLDIAGNWDPSLALVMGGAVGVTLLTFRPVLKLPKPLFGTHFEIPTSAVVDTPLLVGATIFGIGWGIAGYCPGPAIASLTMGTIEPVVFVAAFIVGNFLSVMLDRVTGSA